VHGCVSIYSYVRACVHGQRDLMDCLLAAGRSKKEQINEAIAGKIRKRDEENESSAAGVVPSKDLIEITDARLKSRILYR
jgi:hypothetical protein